MKVGQINLLKNSSLICIKSIIADLSCSTKLEESERHATDQWRVMVAGREGGR